MDYQSCQESEASLYLWSILTFCSLDFCKMIRLFTCIVFEYLYSSIAITDRNIMIVYTQLWHFLKLKNAITFDLKELQSEKKYFVNKNVVKISKSQVKKSILSTSLSIR